MPSRMIHYLVAERVSAQLPIADKNRFYIGSLCPDMSWRKDDSKRRTHYTEIAGDKKGMNWNTFVGRYREEMKQDDLYLGVLCHLITDSIWFCEMAEPRIRAKAGSKEERQQGFMAAYLDFHRLNYLLRREFGLTYHLTEDRNISLDGIHPEFYDDVFGGLHEDFFSEPPAEKEELTIYPWEASVSCIEHCIAVCIEAITAFRKGETLPAPEVWFVPLRE